MNLRASVALAGAIAATTCMQLPAKAQSSAPQDAQATAAKDLAGLGVPFTSRAFEDAAVGGNLPVLRLFFKAGYSPNRVSESGLFICTMAMANNPNNFPEELVLFKQYGLDFKQVSAGGSFAPRYLANLFHRPITQQDELFKYAEGNQAKTKILYDAGADPRPLIEGYRHLQQTGSLDTSGERALAMLESVLPADDPDAAPPAKTAAADFELAGIKPGMQAGEVLALLKARAVRPFIYYVKLPNGRNGPVSQFTFHETNNGRSYTGQVMFSRVTGGVDQISYQDDSRQPQPLLAAATAKWGPPHHDYWTHTFWGDLQGIYVEYRNEPATADAVVLILHDAPALKADSAAAAEQKSPSPKL